MATAANPEMAAALERFRAAAAELHEVGLVPSDADDARAVILELEVGARIARAAQVGLLDEVERSGCHHADGHRSAKVMVRHVAHLSDAEALRRAKAVRVVRLLPAVAAAFVEGKIGACQVDRIARTCANPRIRHLLTEVEGHVAVLAERLPYREFDQKLTDWERLADEDGAGDRATRDHARRDFRIGTTLDGSSFFSGGLGDLDTEVLRDIHVHFVEAEMAADWAEARERLGDDASWDDLLRTDAQRRADALMAMARAAASAAAAAPGGSIVVTNVVMDLATFERHLRLVCSDRPVSDPDPRVATMLGDAVADLDAEPEPVAEPGVPERTPRDGSGFRCGTLDGRPIDPSEATASALLGHVRRVVVGSDGVVVNMGRRTRLFTGPRRLAVMLAQTTCFWPGCNEPVTRCQADHLEGFHGRTRGPTDLDNGGPACGRHNRLKEAGFTARRDERGRWHICRPDGTEIR